MVLESKLWSMYDFMVSLFIRSLHGFSFRFRNGLTDDLRWFRSNLMWSLEVLVLIVSSTDLRWFRLNILEWNLEANFSL